MLVIMTRCLQLALQDCTHSPQPQDYVCDKPALVQCRAYDGTKWVTSETQKYGTLKCTRDEFSCQHGRELDCSTFQVRFLCPQGKPLCLFVWLVGFLASSSTTSLYRGRVPRLASDNFTCCHTRDRAGRP